MFERLNGSFYNGNLTLINNSSSNIRVAYEGNSFFNGNIQVANNGGGNILFGERTSATASLLDGFTISVHALDFTNGLLRLNRFTQIGGTPQNLVLNGTARLFLQETVFNGDLNIETPNISLTENTFNGITSIEKLGEGNDNCVGDNTFNASTTIINSSNSNFVLANGLTNPDIFSADVLFSNRANGRLRVAQRAPGNEFNGNVFVENLSSLGLEIGQGGGTSTLNIGNTFNIGGLGFDLGELDIRGLNQIDAATAQNITLTGTAILYLQNTHWEGNLTGVSPGIIINGNTFNGSTTLEKNGIANNNSNGGNTFNGVSEIINSGDGIFRLSFDAATPDIFNADVTVSNQSNGQLIMSSRAIGNQYNQNIIVENTSPNGVTFGVNGGTSTLNAGGVINIGGLGFATGDLRFQNFTQTDVATPQNITLTGDARLYLYDSEWTASVNFIAPRLYSRTSIFNSTTYLEKNGATNEFSFGGNVYNDVVEIVTSGTGYWRTGNNEGNTFNADVTYSQLNTGVNGPAFGTASFYLGNINLNAPTSFIYIASGGSGYVEFTGNGNQTINNIGSAQNHRFSRLTTNKTGGSLTLNTPTEIVTELNLQQGNITSSLANLLIMRDNSIVSNVSNNAYVEGPVRKIGNDAFTFPTGKNGFYRPCGISAPTNANHHFTAEYFNDNPDLVHDATLFDPSFEYISECEYWEINRTNGASNVNVFLSWDGYDAPTCSGVHNISNLMVSRWDGAQWNNSGNGGTTGTSFSGSISTNAAQTSFGEYTLATLETINNLGRNVINSITDGDWSNTGTWDCTCIPNSPENIVNIRDNHDVTLDGDFITGSLYINELGSLDLSSSELTITQNLSIIGGLNENNGTLNFNGTLGDQYVRGAGQLQPIFDIEINNNDNVFVSDIQFELNGLLNITLGNFDVSNATFIVNSTSNTENGNIGPLTLGTITGDITVRRFIPAGIADYRNISSPLANISLLQWDDDFYMSGPGFPDGCAYGPDGCFRSVKYIENDVYNDVDDINHVLVSGRGYDAYLGDNLNVFSGTVVDVNGSVNTGDISRSFTGGWSLIGNPFASNVNFNLFNRPFIMGNYFYVYDSNTGNYQWYNGQDNSSGNGLGGPGDINNGIIGLGQGIWVFGSGNLTIPQSSKVRTPAMYIKNASVNNGFSIVLTSDVNSYSCDATFSVDANADNSLEIMDITHLKSRNENAPYISSVVSNQNVRLNKFNNNENTLIFPLNVYVTENENYTITVNDINNFSAYSCVYLIDSITGLQYDLKEINTFTFEPNAIEEEETRFVLVMSNSNCDMIEDISLTNSSLEFEDMIAITQRNQQIDIDFDLIKNQNVSIQVFNSLGKMIHNEVLSNIKSILHTIDISGNASGIYSVRVISNNGQKTKQIFLNK